MITQTTLIDQNPTETNKSLESLADILRAKGFGILQVVEHEEYQKSTGQRVLVLMSNNVLVGVEAAKIALENGYPLTDLIQRWRVTSVGELGLGSSVEMMFRRR